MFLCEIRPYLGFYHCKPLSCPLPWTKMSLKNNFGPDHPIRVHFGPLLPKKIVWGLKNVWLRLRGRCKSGLQKIFWTPKWPKIDFGPSKVQKNHDEKNDRVGPFRRSYAEIWPKTCFEAKMTDLRWLYLRVGASLRPLIGRILLLSGHIFHSRIWYFPQVLSEKVAIFSGLRRAQIASILPALASAANFNPTPPWQLDIFSDRRTPKSPLHLRL